MLNGLETILRSPYGIPYLGALGIEVKNELKKRLSDVLFVPAGIMKAAHDDIEHDLLTIEILQRNIHFPSK